MIAPVLNAYVDGDRLVAVRREGGRVVLSRHPAEWVSWHRAADASSDLLRSLRTSSAVKSVQTKDGWLRVGWRNDRARREIIEAGDEGPLGALAHHEADVDPVRLWLTETGAEIARPRRCYIDLEVDSDKSFAEMKGGEARVLAWAVVDDEGRRRVGVLDADDDEDERRLLRALWAELDAYDQVACWNGSWGNEEAFDFLVLWNRSRELGLHVDPRRWLWLDQLVVFMKMNMHSAQSGAEKRSYKLEDIAQAVLGRGKRKEAGIIPGKSLGAQVRPMWDAGGAWRAAMARYCAEDATLLRDIERHTGYLDLFQTVCEACRVFGCTDGINPTEQVDGLMLHLGHQRGLRFSTKKYGGDEKGDKYKGAVVFEPKANGIERAVHFLDFKSMYPSIIIAFNMGPDTIRQIPVNGPVPEGHTRAPTTGIGFTLEEESILVSALREVMRLREFWSAKKASLPPGTPEWRDADRRATAYKVIANIFYGVVGSPFSRFWERRVAESVTQTGVWLIQRTASEAEKRGGRRVYGDTDSAAIQNMARAEVESFVAWCNGELYPDMLSAQGCRETAIVKVTYEKEFDRIVFCSKKRYIGRYAHFKGTAATADSEPEIKGLEFKRGDAGLLGMRLQAEVIDMLVGGMKIAAGEVPTERIEDYHAAVERARRHVLDDALPLEEVVLSKSMQKPLREYAAKLKKDGMPAVQPHHIVVAKMLKERGRQVAEGIKIEYVVKDADADPTSVIPAEDFAGAYDKFHLWESIVFPPTQRLLEAAFPGHDWEAWRRVRPKKERAVSEETRARREAEARQGALFELSVPKQQARRPKLKVVQGGRA